MKAFLALALIPAALAAEHWTHSPDDGGRVGRVGYDRTGATRVRDLNESALGRRDGESDIALAKRLNRAVHIGSHHCDSSQLSWIQQGLTFANSGLMSEGVLAREHFDCGLCSQRAYILDQSLKDSGVDSRMIALRGHVIVGVEVNGRTYGFDPDYGKGPSPYPPTEQTVREQYRDYGPEVVSLLTSVYATPEDDFVYPDVSQIAAAQRRLFKFANLIAWVLATIALTICIDMIRQYFKTTRPAA